MMVEEVPRMNEPQPQEELFGDNESNAVYKELFNL